MAITFNFNEKCGEALFVSEGKEYSINLYVGNCFLIMVNEYQENGKDKYSLYSFFVDEDHMERCLKNDIFSSGTERLVKIRINKAKCRNYKKIVALLVEYIDDITVEVYKEGEQTWKEYKEPEPIISDVRMRELAETAISYLYDEDMLRDFLDDRYIELSDEETEYFGIYDEEN